MDFALRAAASHFSPSLANGSLAFLPAAASGRLPPPERLGYQTLSGISENGRCGRRQSASGPNPRAAIPKQMLVDGSIEYRVPRERCKPFLFALDALRAHMCCAALQKGVAFFRTTKIYNAGSVEDINSRRHIPAAVTSSFRGARPRLSRHACATRRENMAPPRLAAATFQLSGRSHFLLTEERW